MDNRPTKTPPPASQVRPPPRPKPAASSADSSNSLPDLPDIPELPDDIPDEYRPLMRGLQNRPSARSTPHRGVQLPSLNNPNANLASAGKPLPLASGRGPLSPSASGASAPATPVAGRPPSSISGKTTPVRPGQPLKPPSGAGFIKPPSGSGFLKPPSGTGFGKPSSSATGIFKPPTGVIPYAKPPSGAANGLAGPQPVILSNDSSRNQSVSPRSTPARGMPTLTPVSSPAASARLPVSSRSSATAQHVGNRSSQKMGWVCHRCHCKVDPESIVRNEAVMIDGLPLCGRCVREGKTDRLRHAAQIIGAIALCLGTVACLVVFCKTSLTSGKDVQALEQARLVETIAESGNIAEAEQRVAALLSTIESGVCKDPDVISVAYKAEDTLKKRIKSLFGELSPKEHELLSYLSASYPGPDAKHERIRALHVDDDSNVATLTMVFEPAAAQDNFKTDVRAFTVTLLQRFPKLSSVSLTLQYFTGDTLADAGNFSLDRAGAGATVKTGAQIYTGRGMVNNGAANGADQSAPVRMVNPIAPLPPALNSAPGNTHTTPPNPTTPPSQNAEKLQAVLTEPAPVIPANQPGVFDPSKAPAMQLPPH